ncbi:MAG: ABC transporter ATP-binding protein, partial [Lachnospiraceae bacterium]|nr:ABC transporter ATP-binding protein [Lachnospiraceae bacterium]
MKDNYQNIIEIKNLSFAYPNETLAALDHIDLQIREGEFVVLCGKSGCGKSTLLTHLKPPLTPHGRRIGEVYFAGRPISDLSNREQSFRIGYVMQNPDNQIVTDKVWHELAFGLESLGYNNREIRIRVAEMASYFGIQDWFYKNVTDLSGGQKQLLNLASIMAMHPDLLVLDEPASQLDPIAASDFLETVRKINRDLGTTIIITEHRLEDVFPAADRVIVMDQGRILAEGTPGMIGQILKELRHDMFLAMPVPMQVYAKVETKEELPCPVTVRDGRDWLAKVCREREIAPYIERAGGVFAVTTQDLDGRDQVTAGLTASDLDGRDQKTSRSAAGRKPILECHDVWFRYDKNLPDVVRGLNLTVYEGEFYCLLGGNGTGKSTTMSMLCRLRRPYRGRIF